MAVYSFFMRGSGGASAALFSLVTATGPKGTLCSGWISGKVFFLSGWSSTGQDPQGSRSTKPVGVQEVFGQCSQTYGLIFGWSCVELGIGLNDPCGSLPTQDIL